MPKKTAISVRRKTAAEERGLTLSFAPDLDQGETLTGTPTMTATPSGLTFSSVHRNTAVIRVEGIPVEVDQAVHGMVSGGTSEVTYTVTVACGTSAAQTLNTLCTLQVKDA